MSEFEVGDRVVRQSDGAAGEVVRVSDLAPAVTVRWDDEQHFSWDGNDCVIATRHLVWDTAYEQDGAQT